MTTAPSSQAGEWSAQETAHPSGYLSQGKQIAQVVIISVEFETKNGLTGGLGG